MGNRVFGCDDCLAVCPWNKFAAAAREARFHARAETDNPPLAELLQLDDAQFRARFAGTPVKRTGRDRFVRNVLIAAGNSGDASLLPHIEALLGDASPLVRAMAVWAMRQLAGDGIGEGVRRKHLAREGDSDVRAEWHAVAAVMSRLFCFGLGYSAQRVAQRLARRGWRMAGTARTAEGVENIAAQGYGAFVFDGSGPGAGVARGAGTRHARARLGAARCRRRSRAAPPRRRPRAGAYRWSWIGYLSTVGVYGDSQGAWIDETMPAEPTSARGRRRIAAEQDWLALGARRATRTQIFRLAGIYGPGRSAIDRLREGTAHRIVKPGQVFNRIHVDDIAAAVHRGHRWTRRRADLQRHRRRAGTAAGRHHLCRRAVAHAAAAGGRPSRTRSSRRWRPASMPTTSASATTRLRQELGVALQFPTYREGLRAILAEQRNR